MRFPGANQTTGRHRLLLINWDHGFMPKPDNSHRATGFTCSPPPTDGSAATAPDCNALIGHITYAAASAGVVTIDQNGVATAQAPGSTLITGTIAQTSSNAGYFYTCPPAKIKLSVASAPNAPGASITLNTPLALTATVTDTNQNVINGLALTYVSTNPGSIAVSSTGAVTASFPSNSAITAICQPTTCNPAPINVMGTLGTGVPVLSNLLPITSPGQNSNYIWVSSPGSPYFVPIDLSTGTIGNQIKMPYSPNSMVLDPTGTTLYFGSYKELMTYTASTNSLSSEVPNVPGVVLAVSPTNSSVVVNDQLRGVLYIYTRRLPVGRAPRPRARGKLYLVRGNRTESRLHSGRSDGLHRGQWCALYPQQLHRMVGRDLACESGHAHDRHLPGDQHDQSYSPGSDKLSAKYHGESQQHVQHVLLARFGGDHPVGRSVSIRCDTSAYGQCPDTTVKPVVNYPEATTVAAVSDHVASTTDGNHIIGASANPAELTDLSITVPINACPTDANSQTTGITFSPAPVVNQLSLAAYGITNINQVVAATNSVEAFVTYGSAATTPPAGGALLPVYKPSTTAGSRERSAASRLPARRSRRWLEFSPLITPCFFRDDGRQPVARDRHYDSAGYENKSTRNSRISMAIRCRPYFWRSSRGRRLRVMN